MEKLNIFLVDKIFKKINSDRYKILEVKEIIESTKQNKTCKVHLFNDIYLETKKDDYQEVIKRHFSFLLENEEYKLCSELKKLKLI
jgi:hypothetical protein